jgi:ectoine hydroxylase-related dioxygenase (phytanoyl-CoA dioxygenase family)
VTGDHFAAAGQNDRSWNALEKLALRALEVFADYYGNNLIAAVCRAWLGPGYQVTSHINVVNPGGAAQTGHRDYHLGFASAMARGGTSSATIANVIAACAEGYAFPTNLDLDQPADGLAPATQADVLNRAVTEGWSRPQLETELEAWSARRQGRRP